MRFTNKLRSLLLTAVVLATPACGGGIDGGEQGGRAFIALAAFLVLGAIILYVALGRED